MHWAVFRRKTMRKAFRLIEITKKTCFGRKQYHKIVWRMTYHFGCASLFYELWYLECTSIKRFGKVLKNWQLSNICIADMVLVLQERSRFGEDENTVESDTHRRYTDIASIRNMKWVSSSERAAYYFMRKIARPSTEQRLKYGSLMKNTVVYWHYVE